MAEFERMKRESSESWLSSRDFFLIKKCQDDEHLSVSSFFTVRSPVHVAFFGLALRGSVRTSYAARRRLRGTEWRPLLRRHTIVCFAVAFLPDTS